MSNSEIAGILVKLKVDTTNYQKQLKNTETMTKKSSSNMAKSFNSLKTSLMSLAPLLASLAITAKVITGFQALREEVDALQKAGLKLGETTENLSRLKFIAEQSGIGFDTLKSSLTDMNKKISEAKMNTGEAVLALQKLGLSADDLHTKTPFEQFMTIAKVIPQIENASEKIFILDKLMGGAGTELQQVFSMGYDSVKRLADATPNVITQETADRVAEFNDNMHRMTENIKRVTIPVLSTLAKLVNGIFESYQKKSGIDKLTEELDVLNRQVLKYEESLQKLEQRESNILFRIKEKLFNKEGQVPEDVQRLNQVLNQSRKRIKELEKEIQTIEKAKEKLTESPAVGDSGIIDPFQQRLFQLNETIKLLQKEGTKESIKEIKELENTLKELESQAFTTSDKIKQYMLDSTDTWSDNLTDAILSGKDSFRSLGEFAKNILDDIGRQLIKHKITQPLVKAGVSYLSDDFTGHLQQGLTKSGQFLSNLTGIGGRMSAPSLRIDQTINISSGAEVSEIDRKIAQQVPSIVEAAKAGVVEASRNNPVFRR